METVAGKLFACEYTHQSRSWTTIAEADDRDGAITQFRRENPSVELWTCYQVGRQKSSIGIVPQIAQEQMQMIFIANAEREVRT